MADTKDTLGPQGVVDALVSNTLTSLTDSDITGVCNYGLAYKTALASVDILGGGTIGDSAFSGTTALTSLVLRSTKMTTMVSANAFAGTPFEYGEAAVYVPTSVLSSYRADSTWKNYLIVDIADYPLSSYETISDSWSDIITACGNGTYSSKYSLGDVKSITIDGSTYYMQLVAKDADVLDSDGTTTVPTTWVMYRKYYTIHAMNGSNTTSGGWAGSAMRSWLSSTVLPLLPSEVQAAVKEVRKYSDTYDSAIVHDQRTADKLWIPSAREVFGGTKYEQTGPDYTAVLSSNASRNKYGSSGSSSIWWLRSAYNAGYFRGVRYTTGSLDYYAADTSFGVALGFCI